jgi:pyruvate formate-lyase activating enzyme-like uncharacterized protein
VKRKFDKSELERIVNKTVNSKEISNVEREVIYTLELLLCDKHLEDINKRKKAIKGMICPNDFLSFYVPKDQTLDDLSAGCTFCLKNRITHIRHSSDCQCHCDFCYFNGAESGIIPKYGYRLGAFRNAFYLTEQELMLVLEKQIYHTVDAIGWLHKEPLIHLDKMLRVMKQIPKAQYLYTNGILADKDTAKKLADAGLNEIRFNLQATDFSELVLENMKNCIGLFDSVVIETPIYSKSYANFVKHKDFIRDSGIHQINTPELQVAPNTIDLFEKTEGICYRHRKGYTSPLSSRHFTYDLIELAERENWNILINDCSNETKFYRDTPYRRDTEMDPLIQYSSRFSLLPPANYYYIIDKLVDSELEVF